MSDLQGPLVRRLREALIPVLTCGSWEQIRNDHRRVGLPWREDFEPGWGKPKYMKRVVEDLADEEVLAIARRAREEFPERAGLELQDAFDWLEANGVALITEVTRLELAKVLDGYRLHPSESPSDLLARFAQTSVGAQFRYADDGNICVVDVDFPAFFSRGMSGSLTLRKSNHQALLDAYGFRQWPDARLFRLLEFLVHPTVRKGPEQASMVRALSGVLIVDRHELAVNEQLSGHSVFKVRRAVGGVPGRPKNLIFASSGPKPELGFSDAVNNDIVILRHAEHCLIYDECIEEAGLPWPKLVNWWAVREGLDASEASTRKGLADRLFKSISSEPERRMFSAYFKVFRLRLGDALPALLPQVYLHFDPVTLRELRARGEQRRFDVERMDFLLLLPHGARVVIEIDGQQHYSTGIAPSAKPSPQAYARTARGDRRLRLAGYDVYRFGGYELRDDSVCATAVDEFFTRLFRRHKLLGC